MVIALALGLIVAAPASQTLDELVARIPGVEEVTTNENLLNLAQDLARFDREAVPRVLPFLRDPRPRVRDFAGAVLDRLPLREDDLPALAAAHAAGSRCAFSGISRINAPRALRYVVAHVANGDELRNYTQSRTYDAVTAAEFAGFLRSQTERTPDDILNVCSAFTRGGGAPPQPLVAMGELDRARAIQDPVKRGYRLESAIGAFRRLGSDARPALPILIPLLKRFPGHIADDRRLEAVAALGAIGDLRAAPALMQVLNDPEDEDWRAVYVAIEALGRMGARDALTRIDRVALSHWFVTVRQMARYVAEHLRSGRRLDPPFVFADAGLLVPPAPERGKPKTVAPADTLTDAELASHRFPGPSFGHPCEMTYPEPFLVTPTSGVKTADGTFLRTRRLNAAVVFQHGAHLERILTGDTGGVTLFGGNVLATAPHGKGISVVDLPFGPHHASGEETIIVGPNNSALFRIERAADGSHAAMPWKMLPGFCTPRGLLADGRLYLDCQAGDVILRPDGTMDPP